MMNIRGTACLLVVGLAAAALAFTNRQQPVVTPSTPVPAGEGQPVAADTKDLEAIRRASAEFTEAFNKHDAKAVAALWTENAELHEASGELIRGRANIEKAFADFFKAAPGVKLEVLVEAIRFPAADLAIEEGIIRQVRPGKELPGSTLYRVTHIREGGKWRMAVSEEVGAGEDRLEDLAWLLGEWKATTPEFTIGLSLTRDPKKPVILGKFTRTEKNQEPQTGTLRIAFDPQTRRLRSWHFEEDGGHGQAIWLRDGSRWVLDSVGVLANGTPAAGLNILGRIDNDAITWRSIDRVVGGKPLPDTTPIRLNRVPTGK